jgi:carboxyl-terminal processing protease
VQSVIDLPGSAGRESDGAFKVTISKFFRPSGRSNQVEGVPSDIQIPDVFEVSEVGEAENDYPLPHTTINPSTGLKPIQDLSKIIPVLKQKSEARVRASEEFKAVFSAIEKARKEKDNTEVSLKAPEKPLADASSNAETIPSQKVASAGAPSSNSAAANQKKPARTGQDPHSKNKNDDPNIVIRPEDEQLREAASILVDSIELLGGKADWTR